MRIRFIKAHLKKILLCGSLLYVLISLLGKDETARVSIAKQYKKYHKEWLQNQESNERKESNELTLEMIEKLNGKLHQRENSKEEDLLDGLFAQIPGGRQAIANKDPVALEAMASHLQNLKSQFSNKIKISSEVIERLASNAKPIQISNIADSDNVKNNIMTQLIQVFPNLKGNIPVQEAILRKLGDSNFLKIMKYLQNNKSKNIENIQFDELVNVVDKFHSKKDQKILNSKKDIPEDLTNEANKLIISNKNVAKQPIANSQSEQGEINLHELLKLKNMLKNGATVEELKKMYHLQVPQLVGRSLLGGDNDKESTASTVDAVQVRDRNDSEQKLQEGDTITEPERDIGWESNNKQTIGQGEGMGVEDSTVTRDATANSKTHRSEDDDFIYMSSQEFDHLVEAQKGGATRYPDLDFEKIRIAVVEDDPSGMIDNVTKVLTIQNYKLWKAERFVKKVANPFVKSSVKPTLMPYGEYIARPNPKSIIKDLTMSVAIEEIDKALKLEKQRRLALGDDDLLLIPEVQLELKLHPDTITNIVHFIWFSCRKFKVHHFMSMKSALHVHSPRLILLHTDCVPDGPYFKEFTKMAGSKLKIVKRTQPTNIWGNEIEKIEHRSDVARLQVLLEVGGIYMDDDVLLLKPLDPIMNNSIVLGEETYDALANSIVLANKESWFLKRWYQEYKTFNGSKWSHSSCFVPWSLWRLFPDTIHVVKEKMLRPNWEELTYIYHELWDWTNSYSMHLYSRFMEALDGKGERSLQELAVLNTTYGEISRFVLWGDPKPRDITDWL